MCPILGKILHSTKFYIKRKKNKIDTQSMKSLKKEKLKKYVLLPKSPISLEIALNQRIQIHKENYRSIFIGPTHNRLIYASGLHTLS